ncbi:MAG TPA: flagellar biosynthesis protein FlhF [Deltaproteobacteria bacterium]|nr:flagellar biosynthesis protein FlhF [Deltaproteobacteria bacterium]
MAVKRYKAKSIQEAINRIKEDFGPDAMILSTRRLPTNVRNPYGKEIFEVTAALRKPSEESDTHDVVPKDDERNETGAWPHRSGDREGGHVFEKKWKALNAELFSIKDMLFLMDRKGGLPDFLHQFPESLNLYVRLVKTGISERRVQSIIGRALSAMASKGLKPEEITKKVYHEIVSSISVFNPFSLRNGKKHLAAFIGPTGVGKTTTIAKLAAILSLKQGKKVGIISVDSYRIGAVEQLRTYASIMGLPCLSAFSGEDLKKAIKTLQNKDVVLIDTAGQSHLDKDRMKELGRLMKGSLSISTHLVLSATIEQRDMKEAADSFAVLKPESYVFTKLDETRRRGGIIEQICDSQMPISYVTNGQRVPEDIIPADKRSILRFVLG